MPTSVAVLSDIHGVLPALEAVLAEPDVADADRIVLTGDIAAGPQPREVLDRLTRLGERVVWVRGNADRELVELADGTDPDVPDPVAHWAAAQLGPDHVGRLRDLPYPVTLPVEGFGDVLFCHGTPRSDDEVVLVDTRLERWAEAFADLPARVRTVVCGHTHMPFLRLVDTRLERWAEAFADLPARVRTVVCGHTHMPFLRLVDTRLVVNPGSVGMPYGQPGAHWALLRDGEARLRRTDFDRDAACTRIAAESGYPDAAAWADEYVRARNTDADAIGAFGPRDGRLG